MSYDLEIKKEKNFLYAIIKGIRTSNSIKNVTREIIKKCIKYQYTKVIVDVREFKEHIRTLEIFDLASVELPDIINKTINKAAILDNPGLKDKQYFFENVSRNRGHNVQIFTNIIEAEKWLNR